MKQYGLKRILGLVLALSMCVGLLPVSALGAAPGDDGTGKHTVTVTDGTAEPQQAAAGETVILKHQVKPGYSFRNWQITGDATVQGDTLTMGSGDCTAAAIYEETSALVTFVIRKPGADPDERKVSVPLTDGKGTLQADQIPGDLALPGYVGAWDAEPDTGENGITQPVTYTYSYEKLYRIDCQGCTASVLGENVTQAQAGASVVLAARPETDQDSFAGWKVTGAQSGESIGETDSFIMPEEDVTAQAVFADAWKITVTGGTAKPRKVKASAPEQVSVLADTIPGRTFSHWEQEGKEISKENPYVFTPEGPVTLQAVYQVTATFQVENGTWEDGETRQIEKTIYLPGDSTGSLKGQMPEGMKPKAGQAYGSWTLAEDTISQDTVYTYCYIPVEEAEFSILWKNGTTEEAFTERPQDIKPLKLTLSLNGTSRTFEEKDGKITALVPKGAELSESQTVLISTSTAFESSVDTKNRQIVMKSIPVPYKVKLDPNTVLPPDLQSLAFKVYDGDGETLLKDITLQQANAWTDTFQAEPYCLDGKRNVPVAADEADTIKSAVGGAEGRVLTVSGKQDQMKTLTVNTLWCNAAGEKTDPALPLTVTVKPQGYETAEKTLTFTVQETSKTLQVPEFDIQGNALSYVPSAEAEGYTVMPEAKEDVLSLTLRAYEKLRVSAAFRDMNGKAFPWPEDMTDVTVQVLQKSGVPTSAVLTAEAPSAELTFPSGQPYELKWIRHGGLDYQETGRQYNGAKDITCLYTAACRVELKVKWVDAQGADLAPQKISVDYVDVDILSEDGSASESRVMAADSWFSEGEQVYSAPEKILPRNVAGFTCRAEQPDPLQFAYEITYQEDPESALLPVRAIWNNKDGSSFDGVPEGITEAEVDLVLGENRQTCSFQSDFLTNGSASIACSKEVLEAKEYRLEPRQIPGFTAQVKENQGAMEITYTYEGGGLTYTVELAPETVLAAGEKITVELVEDQKQVMSAFSGRFLASSPLTPKNPRVVLGGSNGYRAQVELDRYDDQGKARSYRARILKAEGDFLLEQKGRTFVLRSRTQPANEDVTVSTQWQDYQGKPLTKLPAGAGAVTVTIKGMAKPRTVTLNAANHWSQVITLPKSDQLRYELTGEPENFKTNGIQNHPDFVIRQKADPVQKTVSVDWLDCYGRSVAWPQGQTVSLQLYDQADETKTVIRTVEVKDKNAVLVKDLQATDIDGKPIAYGILMPEPVTISEKTRSYTYEAREVKGRLAVQYIARGLVRVDVKWQDGDEKPMTPAEDQVTFTMVSSGVKTPYAVKKDEQWTRDITLPGRTGIRLADYEHLDGYRSEIQGPTRKDGVYDYHYVITYTKNDNIELLPVEIHWITGGEAYTHLPEGLDGATVQVVGKADGKVVYTDTKLVPGKGYFEVLKTVDGKQVEFTANGLPVAGFKFGEGEPQSAAGDPYTVTYTQEGLPLRAELSGNAVPGKDLEIKLDLCQVPGGEVLDSVTLNEKNSWQQAGEKKLPVYDEEGSLIPYQAKVEPEGLRVAGSLKNGYVVSASTAMKNQKVTIVWKDKEGKALTVAPRASLMVNIKGTAQARTVKADVWEQNLSVTKKGNWTGSIPVPETDLAGNKLIYTVTLQDKVSGYKTTYTGQNTDHVTITLQREKASIIPRTGDSSHLRLWTALGLCAVIGLSAVGVVAFRKKKNK